MTNTTILFSQKLGKLHIHIELLTERQRHFPNNSNVVIDGSYARQRELVSCLLSLGLSVYAYEVLCSRWTDEASPLGYWPHRGIQFML